MEGLQFRRNFRLQHASAGVYLCNGWKLDQGVHYQSHPIPLPLWAPTINKKHSVRLFPFLLFTQRQAASTVVQHDTTILYQVLPFCRYLARKTKPGFVDIPPHRPVEEERADSNRQIIHSQEANIVNLHPIETLRTIICRCGIRWMALVRRDGTYVRQKTAEMNGVDLFMQEQMLWVC